MHVSGAAEEEVTTTAELQAAMEAAMSRRETASTGPNASSSRSHAVCMLRIGGGAAVGQARGVLTLVDLAGSERKEDSMYHDAERRKAAPENPTLLQTGLLTLTSMGRRALRSTRA